MANDVLKAGTYLKSFKVVIEFQNKFKSVIEFKKKYYGLFRDL